MSTRFGTFASSRDLINAIAERLRQPHEPFAGAHVRVAFVRDVSGPRFLTGCAIFCEHHTPSRAPADYGDMVFVEEWVREENDALGFVSKLLAGQSRIGDFGIPNTFTHSHLHHDLHGRTTGWPTWAYISRIDRRHDQQAEIHLAQHPLLRKGLTPYLGPSAAVNEWIFDTNTEDYFGANIGHQEEFVTLIPDRRARFIGAQWVPGTVSCELEINSAATNDVELQLVHVGSSERTSRHEVSGVTLQVAVPQDTDELFMFLVDSSDDYISELRLSSVYQCVGGSMQMPPAATYKDDLLKGEDETREFKPFVKPKDKIETQLLKSVIAFANTRGGRLKAYDVNAPSVPADTTAQKLDDLLQAMKRAIAAGGPRLVVTAADEKDLFDMRLEWTPTGGSRSDQVV